MQGCRNASLLHRHTQTDTNTGTHRGMILYILLPAIPENLLGKLLIKSTTDVEFSFNGVMYKQIDGVAMGSPLGPVLANIFVGHC